MIEDSNQGGVQQQNECFHISKYCVTAEKGQVIIYIQFFSPSPKIFIAIKHKSNSQFFWNMQIEYMHILNECSLIFV